MTSRILRKLFDFSSHSRYTLVEIDIIVFRRFSYDPDFPLAPVRGLRRPRRGCTAHGEGRRRLAALRRHGRAFRPEHLGRHPGAEEPETLRKRPAGRPSDDLGTAEIHRRFREGRRGHHHVPRRVRLRPGGDHPGDPRGGLQTLHLGQARHSGRGHFPLFRARRHGPRHDGGTRLWRPVLHGGHDAESPCHPR